jgi:hypothetical protein
MLSIFLRPAAFLDDWNADSGGQFSDRRWEIDMFVFHHEPKNASPNAAAKTVERLTLRTDMKRRCLFLMKRTERLEICPGALERKIRADYFDDVVRRRDLLNCFGRNHRGRFFARLLFEAMPKFTQASVLSNR